MKVQAAFVAGALAACCAVAQAQLPPREALGASDKYRVLVDKVISKANGWVFTKEHMREIREAGFNVVCPRRGGYDPARSRKQALMAQEEGLYFVAWIRGSLEADGNVKMVWQDGKEQNICSPNSDKLWDMITRLIVEHAKISADVPAFIGTFLDYENYAPDKPSVSPHNCYELSYDQKILREFAAAQKIEMPTLAPAERYPWLARKELHARFRQFQIQSWRARARKLRQQVDSINPRFQFILYPAPGTLLMTEALYPEWGTREAPVVLADPYTYQRPSEFMAEAPALALNRITLLRGMASLRPRGVRHQYLGGIDPIAPSADPEFCGKNASMLAHLSDGYWVFYEGPKYTAKDHGAYFEWFRRANKEIAQGIFELQHLPRATPENLGRTTVDRKTDKPQLGLFGMKSRMFEAQNTEGTFEVHNVEGVSLGYLQQFQVVVLQNFNMPIAANSETSRNLRAYVEQGGGLLLGHDTAWFMESVFPEVAARDVPTKKVEWGRHVVETDLVVAEPHPCLGDAVRGRTFPTEFRDHMIFKAGPAGRIVIRNTFGDPVVVVAEVGKGRVVFSGCYYGYSKPLSGLEESVFQSMLNWLGRIDGALP